MNGSKAEKQQTKEVICMNKTYLKELEQGDLTFSAIDAMYDIVMEECALDFDDFTFLEVRDVLEWKIDHNPFIEGVVERLNQLGINCNSSNTELILTEIRARFKQVVGAPLYNYKAIENWIKGKPVSNTVGENHYALCYALEMNLQETAEFFFKHYLTIPFNYKSRIDAIFFYCLQRSKPYAVAKQMIEESKSFCDLTTTDDETTEIGRQISMIDDDEEFIRFLNAHCYSPEKQYIRARERIVQLIDRYNNGNISQLYFDITGLKYQEDVVLAEAKREKSLPREFTLSFPTDRTLLDLKKEDVPETYETVRKTLILLCFYDYFKSAIVSSLDKKDIWEGFIDEISDILVDCGLNPLYARHPFDRLIIFCAATPRPLDTLKTLNLLRYTEE